jgi:hypothetical protein
VVVEYLPKQVAPATWDVLLNGDHDEARERLETLLGLPGTCSSGIPTHTERSRPSDKETT